MNPASDKEDLLRSLARSVQYCDLCSRMCHRTPVLSAANGDVATKVLIVAEAPGRLGADRTGVPLHGDRTGENFETLLGNIGWCRQDLFITNAVLCNPRDENGNNASPKRREIANCAVNLERIINLIDPEVVVALGAVALEGLSQISPIRVSLRDQVAQPLHWHRRVLMPLYHPGPRALIHRSMLRQRGDYDSLAKLVDPARGLKVGGRRSGVWNRGQTMFPLQGQLQQAVFIILQSLGELSYFKLHKLLFLIDLTSLRKSSRLLTGGTYLRMQEGPWLTTLEQCVTGMLGHEAAHFFRAHKPYLAAGPSPRLEVTLDDMELDIIADVLERYGKKTEAAIKTAAYLTPPMKALIRLERAGKDTRRTLVLGPNSLPEEV